MFDVLLIDFSIVGLFIGFYIAGQYVLLDILMLDFNSERFAKRGNIVQDGKSYRQG